MSSYNIGAVIDYFNRRDAALGFTPGMVKTKTEHGLFAPSPLAPLEECVQALVHERVLPSHGQVLDAGAGDGRVTALFGHMGYGACGIEGDEILAGIAGNLFASFKMLVLFLRKLLFVMAILRLILPIPGFLFRFLILE